MYNVKIWTRGEVTDVTISAADYTKAYLEAVYSASADSLILEVVRAN